MSKWIAEFELEDGDTMPEHMDLEYKGINIDFHCRPLSSSEIPNKSEIPTGSIEIKVGDEVTVEGVNGIVVRKPYPIGSDNELFVLVWYGQRMSSNSLKNVAPTGRHFPQITEVLEQLRTSCCGGLEE